MGKDKDDFKDGWHWTFGFAAHNLREAKDYENRQQEKESEQQQPGTEGIPPPSATNTTAYTRRGPPHNTPPS